MIESTEHPRLMFAEERQGIDNVTERNGELDICSLHWVATINNLYYIVLISELSFETQDNICTAILWYRLIHRLSCMDIPSICKEFSNPGKICEKK